MAQQERGARGLFQYSQVRPRHEQWPRPTPGPWPQALQRDRCLPSPRASIREVVAMTREDTGSSCCPYTLQCLSVCLSVRFLYFCTCILGLDVRPCLCPACHAGLQAPECPLRHTPIWAVVHTAVPGRREQGTSGHDRAPGDGRVAVTSTHIPGLQPMDSSPSRAGLLSCLQPRVRSCAISITKGLYGWQGHPGHPEPNSHCGHLPLGGPGPQRAGICRTYSRKRTWDCTDV